eukprot:g1778.t1
MLCASGRVSAAILLLALRATAAPPATLEEDGVLVLNKFNFRSTVEDRGASGLIVQFYAPWCAHCRTLAPEYAAAAAELKKWEPPIVLAKVDAMREKHLGRTYATEGFPMILAFSKNPGEEIKATPFTDTPNRTMILHFANKLLGNPCHIARSTDDAERWLSQGRQHPLLVLGLVDGLNSQVAAGIQDAARDLLIESCAITESAEVYTFLLEQAVKKKFPASKATPIAPVVSMVDVDASAVLGELQGDGSSKASKALAQGEPAGVQRWVKGRRIPLIITFRDSDEEPKELMKRVKSHSLLLLELPDAKGKGKGKGSASAGMSAETRALLSAHRATARAFRGLGTGGVSHVLVPRTEENLPMCEYLGLDVSKSTTDFPAQVFLNITGDGQHKKMPGATSTEIRKALEQLTADGGDEAAAVEAVHKLLLEHETRFFFGGGGAGGITIGDDGDDADSDSDSAAGGGDGDPAVVPESDESVEVAVEVLDSAQPPDDDVNAKAVVKTVVGSTFEQLVLHDDEHDVLLLLSTTDAAAECESCADVAEEYAKLAKLLRKEKVNSIVVASMDVAKNKVKHRSIPEAPVLPEVLLFRAQGAEAAAAGTAAKTPASLREWASAQGAAVQMVSEELEGLVEFLKERASLPFVLDGEEGGGGGGGHDEL